MPALAYLVERYPAFTQTFIAREIAEIRRQGIAAPVFSLRPGDENSAGQFPPAALENIVYLPESETLIAEIKRRRASGELPKTINQRLEAWDKKSDKGRLYEAIWTGALLKKQGITHLHVHFAGMAARTACLIKELYGITYSFTGHAQDIFCKTDYEISLGRLLREASAVITVADFSAQKLQYTYPAFVGKIHRVYNGLAIPVTLPERRENGLPLILSIGRLIPKKGFADLIRACSLLRAKNVPFRCEIVGDGPQEEELRKLIEEENLAEKVCLRGPLSQTAIGDLWRETRVFALAAVVLPDGDSDNLPTVLTEAMAAGVPSVSTKVAGIPEQIIDGESGFLVEPGNVSALADALEKLLKDQTLAAQFGKKGFERATALFLLEKCVQLLRKKIVPRPWWRAFLP